jgi:DnaJ-domain-containing protein 1
MSSTRMASNVAVKTAVAAATTSTRTTTTTCLLLASRSRRSQPMQRTLSSLASAPSPSLAPHRQSQQARSYHSFASTSTIRSSSSGLHNSNNHNHKKTTVVRFFSSKGKRDLYELLGVDRTADKGAVKKAYYKLAKQYHPDTNKVRCVAFCFVHSSG